MSLYAQLRNSPPKLDIKADAREVIFFTVSCMCDNKHKLTLKKNNDGEFRLHGNGQALSNFQFKGGDVAADCEWEADNGNWDRVVKFINSGTSVIEKVRCR